MLIALSLYYEDLGSNLDSRRADAKSTPSYFLRPTYISIIINAFYRNYLGIPIDVLRAGCFSIRQQMF